MTGPTNYGPLREVVGLVHTSTKYNRPGEGRTILTLGCGHTVMQKRSLPVPLRAHCRRRDCGKEILAPQEDAG